MRLALVIVVAACNNATPQAPLDVAPYRTPCVTGYEGVFNALCLETTDAATGVAVRAPYDIQGFTPVWGQTMEVHFDAYDVEDRPNGVPPIRYVMTHVDVIATEAAGTPFTLEFPRGEDIWFSAMTAETVWMVDHDNVVSCTADLCNQLVALGMDGATIDFEYATTGAPIVATAIETPSP